MKVIGIVGSPEKWNTNILNAGSEGAARQV